MSLGLKWYQRVDEAERVLWTSCSPTLCSKQRFTHSRFWISPWMETPQPLWSICFLSTTMI